MLPSRASYAAASAADSIVATITVVYTLIAAVINTARCYRGGGE